MSWAFPFAQPASEPPRDLSLHPSTHFLIGAALLASCLISEPATSSGAACIAGTVATSWVLFRPKVRHWGRFALFGLAMFAPVFLFLPWVAVPEGSPSLFSVQGFLVRLPIPWRIFARGEAVLLVTSAAMGSMTTSDFQAGLARLPLPRILVALTAQIVHHTGMLATETRRIGQAMALRGGTTGLRASMLVVGSLPSAWLPRVIERADRVAAAMELRGYDGMPIDFESRRFQKRGAAALLVAVMWMIGAGLMRYGSFI